MPTVTIETYSTGSRPTIKKDPNAVLDYSIDWTDWLAEVTDTIVSAAWTLDPPLIEGPLGHTNTAATATCWISGGVAGNTYKATCRITTTEGRIDDRTIYLKVQER